ncbi:hypothetical protein D3C86_1420280 [compost metagenome]
MPVPGPLARILGEAEAIALAGEDRPGREADEVPAARCFSAIEDEAVGLACRVGADAGEIEAKRQRRDDDGHGLLPEGRAGSSGGSECLLVYHHRPLGGRLSRSARAATDERDHEREQNEPSNHDASSGQFER